MKVTQEKLPASQIGLEIEITPEMSKQAYEKTLQEFTRSANIPGFRKGKVPRQILIQRFGATRIKAAVIEELIESSLKQAIEQEKIDAIGNFQLRSAFEDLVSQFQPGSALTFSAAVDVPPNVTLKQIKGLSVKAEEVLYDSTKVDNTVEDYRQRASTLIPVEGRAAQAGDMATVDFKGMLKGNAEEDAEEEIPGGSAEDFQIELVEGKFIPGFIDGIIGMEQGETKEVSVQFPEDYPQETLASQNAVFTITLKELKEKELPELDDDFAQDVSEFETMADFRQSIETRFQEEAAEKTKGNKEQALLEALVEQIEVDLPETLVNREVDYMITQTAMQLSNQGMDVKRLFTPEVIPQLRERSRDEALLRLKRTLAMGEVAKQESIIVDDAAIEAKSQEMLASFPDEEVDPERLRQVVQEDLLKEKILSWLEEHGTVELVPEGSLQPAAEEAEEEDDEMLAEEQSEDQSGAAAPSPEMEASADDDDEPAAAVDAAPDDDEKAASAKS